MTLRRKLVITFCVVFTLVGIQAAVAVVLLTQVVEGSALLVRPALGRVDTLAHMEADMLRLRTLEYTFVWSSNDAARDQARSEMDDLKGTILRRMDDYAGQQPDARALDALTTIRVVFADFLISQEHVVDVVARGDQFEAVWEYLRSQPLFQRVDDQVHGLRHQEYAATEALRDQMVQAAVWARWPMGISVALVALGEVALGWYISQSIARSLDVLQNGARRIAQEQFDDPIPSPPEKELATLADTLNTVMIELAANREERARMEVERLQLLHDRLTQVVKAQEEERARVSRELHDQAGQAITALQYGLSRLKRLSHDAVVAKEVDHLVILASDSSRQISALARDLRPAVLDDLGLVPALRSYTHELAARIDLPVSFAVSGTVPRLAPDAETAIFRVVQEALTNVAKHAHAQHAWVELAVEGGHLAARVRDDGRGFDPQAMGTRPGAGLGLAGIRERVQLLGGQFELRSTVGEGSTVLVTVPMIPNSLDVPRTVKDMARV